MFTKIKTNSLHYKTSNLPSNADDYFCLPALTAGIQNQGLNNYVPLRNATMLKNVISISANGANTGATFYQSKEFTVLQDAYAIEWIYTNSKLTDKQYLFLVGCISKTIYGNYEWTNKAGWERIKEDVIFLPETESCEIDSDFMENFVAELEARRVAELEAYLLATGLKDYALTEEERNVLENYNTMSFGKFAVTDVFDIKNTSNILSCDITKNSGETPYLCASAENNSVSSYISYNRRYIEEGNCIFIGGKTFVVSWQKEDFFSNDSHNLALYYKGEQKDRLTQLFLATCIKKSLCHKYSWGNSISKSKIKEDYVDLPVKDCELDLQNVKTLISAIQKLVIKDVVLYADRKIAETKAIITK